jgi:phosphoribosylamine---glycine ligase
MNKIINFLFISKWGEILDIAYTVMLEGNNVRLYIENEKCKEIGDGFVEKVDNWKTYIDWADLIIFDYTGYGKEASILRESGKKVIGGSEYTDKLELDRSFGQDELKRNKIKIINYKEFHTFQEAIDYVKANPNTYVIKPSGEIQDYKQLLFVGQEEDGSDIVRVLKAYEKTWGNEMGTFHIQKKVNGVEISVAAFFNGKEFLKPINITFEHKKLFPKELGVSTGEMGTSMFWTENNPIFQATLKKFETILSKEKFVGHIDINCIVNGHGIFPLEFTSRFGYPQIFIQRAGMSEPIGNMLYKLANGENFKIATKKGFQVGAYIVVPPFPYEDLKTFETFSKDAVVVIKKPMKNGIHLMHLKQVNNEWLITGDTGIALLVSATGLTMKEAQKLLYSRIQNILINNSYYRTDIGDRWSEDSDKLWAWGLL